MNYLFLKNILEMTIAHFTCQQCAGKIQADAIIVKEIDTKGVVLEIACPHCKSLTGMRAEVNMVAAEQMHDMLTRMKHSDQRTLDASGEPIHDEDIIALYEELKKSTTVTDLFKS